VDFPVNNVKSIAAELEKHAPSLYAILFQAGSLNGFVNFYLNQQCLTRTLDENLNIGDDDVIKVVVSVSGG
jgi:hypothetical protein